MKEKKILILIDSIRPSEGGSNLFNKIIKYNKNKKEIIILSETDLGFLINSLIKLYLNRYFRYLKNRYSFFCKLFIYFVYNILLFLLVKALFYKYKHKEIIGIWARSNDIFPILASVLSEKLNCQLHISIFDIPFTYSIHKYEFELIQKHMKSWITKTNSFDFASQGMKDFFHTHLINEKKHIIIWSSAGVNIAVPYSLNIRENINYIAFCGSLRFFKEFEAFSDAIRIINLTKGRNMELKVFSTKKLKLPFIKNCGYIGNEDMLIKELRKCDLAYSPLSFKEQDRILVETSFPGKISTYLLAGLPILAHAPSYASNYKFVENNQVGIGINTLKPKEIAERILDYEKRLNIREIHSHNSLTTLKESFCIAKRKNFLNNLFE